MSDWADQVASDWGASLSGSGDPVDLEDFNLTQLRTMAAELEISGRSSMDRAALEAAITAASG
jgi:hypothetical protein